MAGGYRRPYQHLRTAVPLSRFGLKTALCPHDDCRAINPLGLDEIEPDNCPRCGKSLKTETSGTPESAGGSK